MPGCLEWIFLLVAAVLVGGSASRVRRSRVNRGRARVALGAVAERWNGRVVEGPAVEFRRAGYAARVELRSGRPYWVRRHSRAHPFTEVVFRLEAAGSPLRPDGWLAVSTVSFPHELARSVGVRDVELDDPEFDAPHEVRASDPGLAYRTLLPDTRWVLRELARRWEYTMRLTSRQLSIRVHELLYMPGELLTLVNLAVQVFDTLGLPEAGAVRVEEVRVEVNPEAICEVCGSSLSQGVVVRCARCATPHHRDCWEFNRGCSVFACGEANHI